MYIHTYVECVCVCVCVCVTHNRTNKPDKMSTGDRVRTTCYRHKTQHNPMVASSLKCMVPKAKRARQQKPNEHGTKKKPKPTTPKAKRAWHPKPNAHGTNSADHEQPKQYVATLVAVTANPEAHGSRNRKPKDKKAERNVLCRPGIEPGSLVLRRAGSHYPTGMNQPRQK